jgi:chorismate-pyruvate lyase
MSHLSDLVGLFFDDSSLLGTLTEIDSEQMPTDFRRLLVHQEHMTVALEAFHENLVDVEALEVNLTATHYARKSLLLRQRDAQVVQFCIMRVALACLTDQVRQEIESQSRPLGRILVRHNVLRIVHPDGLWRVSPGPELRRIFELHEPRETYGRTASIEVNGQAAIEVLEILHPSHGEPDTSSDT